MYALAHTRCISMYRNPFKVTRILYYQISFSHTKELYWFLHQEDYFWSSWIQVSNRRKYLLKQTVVCYRRKKPTDVLWSTESNKHTTSYLLSHSELLKKKQVWASVHFWEKKNQERGVRDPQCHTAKLPSPQPHNQPQASTNLRLANSKPLPLSHAGVITLPIPCHILSWQESTHMQEKQVTHGQETPFAFSTALDQVRTRKPARQVQYRSTCSEGLFPVVYIITDPP